MHVCTLLYTHVYTTVYTRVHKCTLSIFSVGLACMSVSGDIIPRIFSDGLRLPGSRNNTPEDPKAGVCERDHASALTYLY